MPTSLERHVAELRGLAQTLMPYSFPKAGVEEDQEVIVLRTRQLVVDGFDAVVTFCISDYDDYQLESLQVQGVYTPFLPFALVCKIARCFLGSENISYADAVRENRKIYCWSLRRKDGSVLPPVQTPSGNYEGFTYSVMKMGGSN